MASEPSYDAVPKPFNHDKTRGKWSSPQDFLFTCLGHAFKVDAVFILPSILIRDLGIYGLLPYIVILATCVFPIVFIQSFLGQFSGTGFLSVFRIAPSFKGVGYVSLLLNFVTLMYFSVFGAIPLFYFFNTLRPTIPWSCEGATEWMEHKKNALSPCFPNHTMPLTRDTLMEVPSLEFFRVHLNTMDLHKSIHPEGTFSWALMMCTFLMWVMVAGVVTRPIDVIARVIRYSCIAVLAVLGLCVIRFAFLPGAITGLMETLFDPSGLTYFDVWAVLPIIALSALGPGYGTVLTMSSFNPFRTDVLKYSWILCLAQFGVMLGLALMSIFVTSSLQRGSPKEIFFIYMHAQWMEFLVTPTALTFIELPRIWSLLFFTMMILGSLNLLIVHLFSVLTSLFDDYEQLRTRKREVTITVIGVLAITSIYFCSNYGLTFSELLTRVAVMTQMLLNFFLLVIVVWVYGRERFQTDLTFMTSRVFATWKINVVRFVTPLFLIIGFVGGYVMSLMLGHSVFTLPIVLIAVLMWCCVPGYCIVKLRQTRGMLGKRFKRSVRPIDWYPADPEERQRYEEALNTAETIHQMTTTAVG